MKIYSLYRDFFQFLSKAAAFSPEGKWKIYFNFYYRPHKDFLKAYFSHFPLLNFNSLKKRVEKIKEADYSQLRSLILASPPEKIISRAYERCRMVVPPKEEPEVYLFVGFFSPDGFVMEFKGKPVICFGLERFKDFSSLDILFAHEYAHFLLNSARGKVSQEEKAKWLLILEGIGTYFSRLAFPCRPLFDHFLFDRNVLNWCQANEQILRKIYCSQRYRPEELVDFYKKGSPELDLPPRAGKYLGFQAVKRYLAQAEERNISLLLSDKKIALSLELQLLGDFY